MSEVTEEETFVSSSTTPAVIRTALPAAWSTVIVLLITKLFNISPEEAADFMADNAVWLVPLSGFVTGVVYRVFRILEEYAPSWLTYILLGSTKTPLYES